MQFVGLRDVREGMCVAEDIRDQFGRTLLARGQKVGQHHIVRLRKFGVESIFIDERHGENIPKPTKSELRDQCVKVLSGVCGKLAQEFAAKRIVLDAQAIQAATDNLVESLINSRNSVVTLLDVSTSTDKVFQHSVNTAVLATALGVDLRVPAPMLKDLAAAMLFHDIGMIFLPDTLLHKTQPLTAEEFLALRNHPLVGFEHLARTDAVSSVAANIVLRHHEALDGTGYPHGMGGDKLSILMRIAAVAEAYDSLTSTRFGIPAALPDAVVSYMVANANKRFASEIVVALCKRIALYPVGTAVQLNSGEFGVVAGILPRAPMRPVILAHTDNRGKPLKEPVIVDLTQDMRRTVARSGSDLQTLMTSKDAARPVDPNYATIG